MVIAARIGAPITNTNKKEREMIPVDEFLADCELDARGLSCPLPLLKTKQALHKMASGQRLKVLATDPGSQRDIAAFAELSGHTLDAQAEQQGCFIYCLTKA